MKTLCTPANLLVLAGVSLFSMAGCTPAAKTVTPSAPVPAPSPAPAVAEAPAPEPEPAHLHESASKPALPATVVLDGTVLKHTTAGWKLEPQGQTAIHQLAEWIRAHAPGAALVVTGYSSPTGTPAQNLLVSRHRAEFIAKALNSEGVLSGMITVHGLGAGKTVASNATREGRLKNERVEVSFQEHR